MTMTAELDELMREKVIFTVVHPLDDASREEVDTEHLGPMQMTSTVRTCLSALREYLLLMLGLLGFRVLQLAGAIRP